MKILRVCLGGILTFCICFTSIYGIGVIGKEKEVIKIPSYKGILTLWHIDGFEGGIGSRKQFLLDTAVEFERENEGTLVMVIAHTNVSAEESIKNGVYPDLISYSNGLNFNEFCTVKGETSKSLRLNGKSYGKVWCRGSYYLIENPNVEKESPLLVSQNEYTQPLIALTESEVEFSEIEVLPPMDAYVKFLLGKNKNLLATQRDLWRLNRRGFNFKASAIEEFNDLEQYISIVTKEEEKYYSAQLFIEKLTSEKIQSKLSSIGMFSFDKEVRYQEEYLNQGQEKRGYKTLSAFIFPEELKEFQRNSLEEIKKGNKTPLKIKNLLL